MKFLSKGSDGGPDSGVTGYWLVEIKPLFSVVLLRFAYGSREAYHSHAFNALTWWLRGAAIERNLDGTGRLWTPSIIPKLTRRDKFHKVISAKTTWAISFRGPWKGTWQEYKGGRFIDLTHGRVEI